MQGFEWDTLKAEANLEKHGVSFSAAARVFEDTSRIEWHDTRYDYGEERYLTVGEVNAELLTVAYTMRSEVVRIISARRASLREKKEYHGDRPL